MKFIRKDNDLKIVKDNESVDGYFEVFANSVDASLEKHVPIYYIFNDKINVQVGKTLHPMEENHYIMWICLVNGDDYKFCYLKPGDEPNCVFDYIPGSKIYAYCNLHSLWVCEVK